MPSTGNILDVAPQGENDSRSECSLYQALNTGKGVSGFHGHHPTDAVNRPQELGIADSQVLDVANQGRGIAPSTESITVGIGGEATAIASPLYQPLLIERLTDSVIRAEEHAAEIAQYRAEEEATAEEGALIDASGYNDPATSPRFA